MSTWHQRKNPAPLFHDTLWTIVHDPPNEMTGLTQCVSEEEAHNTLARWREHNPGKYERYTYVLPPKYKPGEPIVMEFRELKEGDIFEFTPLYKGMAHGPWQKISARKYKRVSDGEEFRVGAVSAKVEKHVPVQGA